jgi:hypothetical protein
MVNPGSTRTWLTLCSWLLCGGRDASRQRWNRDTRACFSAGSRRSALRTPVVRSSSPLQKQGVGRVADLADHHQNIRRRGTQVTAAPHLLKSTNRGWGDEQGGVEGCQRCSEALDARRTLSRPTCCYPRDSRFKPARAQPVAGKGLPASVSICDSSREKSTGLGW